LISLEASVGTLLPHPGTGMRPLSRKAPRAHGCNGAARAMIGIIIAKPMEPKSAIPF